MDFCEIDLTQPHEQLALEEALLDACDCGETGEVLRVWQAVSPFVVVGYANQVRREVEVDFCRESGIPILRRCSGGGTILQARGCLNYSLTLHIDSQPALGSIKGTNRYVMEKNAAALAALTGRAVEVKGHTDLAIGGFKFSGNAQRRRKHALLFHGCLLLNADLALIERTLKMPSSQPEYRQDRSHKTFLMNLNVSALEVSHCLRTAWGAWQPLQQLPLERMRGLLSSRYSREDWHFSR